MAMATKVAHHQLSDIFAHAFDRDAHEQNSNSSFRCLPAVVRADLTPEDEETASQDEGKVAKWAGVVNDSTFQEPSASEHWSAKLGKGEQSKKQVKRPQWLMAVNVDSANEVKMAALSEAVYRLIPEVADWTLAKSLDVYGGSAPRSRSKRNHVGIYVRKLHRTDTNHTGEPMQDAQECTLAFEGTTSMEDWIDNATAKTRYFCGYQYVHFGFSRVLNKFLDHENFKDLLAFLQNECDGGVNLAGHSLGGAQAVLMAACAIEKNWFTVKGLYTIGAPSVTRKEQIRPSDGNPCFEGVRMFNKDAGTVPRQDIIPVAATAAGFLHPKLKALRVSRDDDGVVTLSEIPCDSPEAAKEPLLTSAAPSGLLHKGGRYVLRLNAASQKQSLDMDDVADKGDTVDDTIQTALFNLAKAANAMQVVKTGAKKYAGNAAAEAQKYAGKMVPKVTKAEAKKVVGNVVSDAPDGAKGADSKGSSLNPDVSEAAHGSLQLKITTWNIAAVNKNPFEYWLSYDDPEYQGLMADFEKVVAKEGAWAGIDIVKVAHVLTPAMFSQLVSKMEAAVDSNNAHILEGARDIEAKYWKQGCTHQPGLPCLSERSVVSEFLLDKLLGLKRLTSMPDRNTLSIPLADGSSAVRPSVISKHISDFGTKDDWRDHWWPAWLKFMFDDPLPIAVNDQFLNKRPIEMLQQIKQSKYPAITNEEAADSLPLQLVCLAVFDAILVYTMHAVSESWVRIKQDLVHTLIDGKEQKTEELLAGHISRNGPDIICLQEVGKVFVKTLRESQFGDIQHYLIHQPADFDPERAQNSIVLLRRDVFPRVAADVTSVVKGELTRLLSPFASPLANGDLIVVLAKHISGVRVLVSSFHGDTQGHATNPVISAVMSVYNMTSSVLEVPVYPIIGVDANVYQKKDCKKKNAKVRLPKELQLEHVAAPVALNDTWRLKPFKKEDPLGKWNEENPAEKVEPGNLVDMVNGLPLQEFLQAPRPPTERLDIQVVQPNKVWVEDMLRWISQERLTTAWFSVSENYDDWCTVRNARTSIQAQLQKAVKRSDIVRKGGINPKDHILYLEDTFVVLPNAKGACFADNTGEDRYKKALCPSLVYKQGEKLPLLGFPSDHAMVHTALELKPDKLRRRIW